MAGELFEGTWKLALEKSRIAADLQIEEIIMTITRIGPNSFRTVQDITFKSGEKRHQEFDRTLDGKEHSVAATASDDHQRSIIARRIDANTREITNKLDGKVTEKVVSVVAPDGHSMKNVEHESSGNEWVSIYVRP
ncbi:MAG: hypothetical protein ABI616_08000 [Pseudomonadota bacterium]